ncbi:MAG: hypothetical protein H0V89_05955 [Deltaproteobacteria bacterium]|nr:hypothetical protein [Deltaproteobacteria bacterium]
MPDNVHHHLPAIRHQDAIAIDVEDLPVEDSFVGHSLGVSHSLFLVVALFALHDVVQHALQVGRQG